MSGPAEAPAGPGAGGLGLDHLATAVVARLAPLTFAVAASEPDRDAVLRMRYRCVVEEGWARPEDHPDGRERDEYDDASVFVVCRDGDSLAGSLRLVPPSPDRPLPAERAFGIRARPAGAVVEVGRVVVAPEARAGRSHLVLAGLAALAWVEARARGYRGVISTATAELIELYRGLGLHVRVLGPARPHWGAPRAPVQIEGDGHTFAFVPPEGVSIPEAGPESAATRRIEP